MDEFEFIRDCLAPLAGPEGLRLEDDAACFTPTSGHDLVITKDAMVEGVHFPQGEYGGNVAEKLLRVNLSDLAAKGARPLGYFLSLAIPAPMTEPHLSGFVRGLSEVQQAFDFTLWGGDTVSTSGLLVVSATFIGQVPHGEMVRRSGAQVGDDVWVTGAIGDAYLGLQNVLGRKLSPTPTSAQLLTWEEAYLRPEPRLIFRKALRKYANAALDISDGFLADAEHLAQASHVDLEVALSKIPLSYARSYERLLSGGDDYEVLFTADPKYRIDLAQTGDKLQLALTHIGRITKGNGNIIVQGSDNLTVNFTQRGYKHKI